MKVFVTTKQTQGQRTSDFCWTPEGEIVKVAMPCDRDSESIDGICGCRRSVVGIESRKGSTTFTVVEKNISQLVLRKMLYERELQVGYGKEFAKEVVKEGMSFHRLASRFPLETVLELRGETMRIRDNEKPNSDKGGD